MFKYFISDIDGCLNDGRIYWDALGQKPFKAFGNYDHDGVKLLRDYVKLIFISADRHGWDILKSRVADHMKCELHYVPEADRYNFVAQYGFNEVAYMGDGIFDAKIIRAVSSQAVIPDFLAQHIEIAAGVKQQLEADTKDVTGLRMLPERFMVINQAMGVPKTKGTAAAAYLRHFVEEMKANGFVKDSMTRHGIQGAGVGGAANPDTDPLDLER